MESVEIFAGADGSAGHPCKPCHGVGVFCRERIFQPHWLDMLERIEQLHRVAHAVLPMALNCHVDIWANDLAIGFHSGDDAMYILVSELQRIWIVAGFPELGISRRRHTVALELESREAIFIVRDRCFRLMLPCSCVRSIAVRNGKRPIETDMIAEASSQQIADRCLQDPPCQIPKRDFDTTCGGHGDSSDSPVTATPQ